MNQQCPFRIIREVAGRSCFHEGFHSTLPGQDNGIDNMATLKDSKSPVVVLLLDRVTNVYEFVVFEGHEVVFLG